MLPNLPFVWAITSAVTIGNAKNSTLFFFYKNIEAEICEILRIF